MAGDPTLRFSQYLSEIPPPFKDGCQPSPLRQRTPIWYLGETWQMFKVNTHLEGDALRNLSGDEWLELVNRNILPKANLQLVCRSPKHECGFQAIYPNDISAKESLKVCSNNIEKDAHRVRLRLVQHFVIFDNLEPRIIDLIRIR